MESWGTRPASRWAWAAAVAAAAVLVVVAVTFLGKSAPMTLADVQKALEAQKWIHTKIEVATRIGELEPGGALESWVGFDPAVVAVRWQDGRVWFDDVAENTRYEYDPNRGTIQVSPRPRTALDGALSKSPLAYFRQALDLMKAKGATITQRKSQRGGQSVEVIEARVDGKEGRVVLVCEPRTQLPVTMEAWGPPEEDAEFLLIYRFFFDYPDVGPVSIHDLGVPRSAKVLGTVASKPFADGHNAVVFGQGYGPIRFDMKRDELIEVAGEPQRRQGTAYEYAYEYLDRGYAVMFDREGKVAAIMCGDANQDSPLVDRFSGATLEGIHMGSSLEEVKAAYGRPDRTPPAPHDSSIQSVSYADLGAEFIFRDGALVHITMRRVTRHQ